MVQINDLNFAYSKRNQVLSGLNLTLRPGHIYGLLGKNGAGKSTLLKSIGGLSFPQSGSCLINGMESAKRSVKLLQDLFFLAEDVFVPALTSAQFLKRTAGFYPKFSIADYYSYLKLLDVDPADLMDKMSYGQQKKAMIAFGLATNTSVLIMDEPTNGLDIPSKVQFRKLIASALSEDRCVLISTHQVRDLDTLIDTVLVLNDKKIVIDSTVDTLTEKLVFGVYEDTTGLPVLYEEDNLRGKYAILKNTTAKYSKLDLELLFNAVIYGDNDIINVINEASRHEWDL